LGTQCDYLHDYLRIDFQNNPVEVLKLQIFLKNIEGENGVAVNGTFDQATFDAVSRFQIKYQPDILTPWGYAQGEYTGYVYILTKKKINEIVCNELLSLNPSQLQEISNFKSFLDALRQQGISVPGLGTAATSATVPTTTVAVSPGIISNIINNQGIKNVAAALFSAPQGLRDTLKALFAFLLVLIAAYVVAEEAIKRFLKTDDKDAERLRRLAIVVGFLAGAIAVASILKYFVIILPIIILMLLLVVFAGWIVWSKRKTDTTNKMKGFGNIPPSIIISPPPSTQ
jgi:hypothetical protein